MLKKIEQNQFQYAIIKKSDLLNRPSNLSLRSILNFPADNDYVLFFEHDSINECCTLKHTEKGVRLKESFSFDQL